MTHGLLRGTSVALTSNKLTTFQNPFASQVHRGSGNVEFNYSEVEKTS